MLLKFILLSFQPYKILKNRSCFTSVILLFLCITFFLYVLYK